MKHLVECRHCQIQFDATGRTVGSQFRCHCGQAVTVSQPQTDFHLQVVRCSNCGAGREDSRPFCSFCNAEFSLSARDLDLICPHCTERTGTRSKFCHLCGVALTSGEMVGEVGNLDCPRCEGVKLSVRQLGEGITIQECESCVGIWLPKSIFARLETRSIDAGRLLTPSLDIADSLTDKKTKGVSNYIKCPGCKTIMNRKNYQRVSGIMIDVCVKDGIWFDAGELAQLVAWLSTGGQHVADAKAPKLESDQVLAGHRDRMKGLEVYPEGSGRFWGGDAMHDNLLMDALELGGMLVGKLFK